MADQRNGWRIMIYIGKRDKTHQNRLGSYLYAAIIADCISEQISNLTQWQLPCASKSMRCPARIRTFIPVMEAAVHHIGIKIV